MESFPTAHVGSCLLLTFDGGLWVYWVQEFKAGYSAMVSAGVKLGEGLR